MSACDTAGMTTLSRALRRWEPIRVAATALGLALAVLLAGYGVGVATAQFTLESAGAAPESFNYKKSEIEHDGVPYLAEAAFGYCPKGINERRIITGVNWSPAISGDPFRRLGDLGQSLGAILTKQRAGPSEPIITVLHLACPRIEYLDRGKSSVNLP